MPSELRVDKVSSTTSPYDPVFSTTGGALSHRNLIINGAMQVWQRSTDITCSDGSNEDYNSVDRWQPNFNGSCPGTLDIDRSTDTPDGFGYSQKLKCAGTGTPTGSNQMSHWRYKIEAQDLVHLNYGSSSAKVMTFSWYMKSVNYTSPLTFMFYKNDNTNAYYLKSVTPTTSWARYSLTIPANTNSGHGIDNDNGEGMVINIMLSGTSGGLYEQTGDSTAWGTSVKYFTNTQGNFFSSTSNELYITGVQLELGSVATPFEMRSHGEELIRCQRYYYGFNRINGTTDYALGGNNRGGNARAHLSVYYPTTMRADPTASFTDGAGTSNRATYHSGNLGNGANHGLTIYSSAATNNRHHCIVDPYTGYDFYLYNLNYSAEL